MKERTKQYVFLRKQNTRIQYIIVMMSFFIMLSVTLSLTQVADATNISASCGYVEHTHTPDCYYRKLSCTNTDPGHTHDLECFDYVLVCGQHGHRHNATCFETKDTGHFVTLLSLFSPVNQTQSDAVVVSMAPKPVQEIIEMPETEPVHKVPAVILEQQEQKQNQNTAAVHENNTIPEQYAGESNAEADDEPASNGKTASQPAQTEVQVPETKPAAPALNHEPVEQTKPVESNTEDYSIHPAEETIVLQPVDLNTPEPEIHDPVEYQELTESIEVEYPAVISYLNISPAVVQPGQSVTFDFQAENAEAYFYRIYSNDEEYESGNLSADSMSFVWNPEISGEYTFALTVYNSSGSIDSETVKGVVYTEEKKEEWLNTIKGLTLTGSWAEDLVTVASSQNGFLASDIASMVDADPVFRSRSDSIDSRFIAFCMNYAGINSSIISDYTKEDDEIHKGDVLFFDYQKDGTIDHMAVVTECSEGIAYVIEVGQNGLVRDEWYSIYDEAIAYHFDTQAAEVDYGTYPLTYEGEDFIVTADAYHVSGIMEDASVRVIEKDEAYEKEEPDKKILSHKSYEIVFVNSEEEIIVPVKDIHITVAYKGEEQVLLDGRAGSTRKKNTLELTGREDLTFFEAWYERILKLEAEEGNVKVTFTYSENTELPLNTRLEIREITDEAEYSSYLKQANEAFDTVNKASFYEVGIYEGDIKADPEGTLQVEVNTEGKEENNAVYAMHYVDETVIDIADVEKEESIVSFEKEKKEEVLQTENTLRKNSRNEATETTNVVGIIETVMETKVITADGETYSIEVAYGPEAQLPANAKLSASEIREDDERYAAYIERMRAFRTEETETSFRLFDIAIQDENGNEIEPGKPVNVSIKLTDVEAVKENVQAYHFTDEETADEINAEAEGNAISFSADSFSVYGVAYTVDFSYSDHGKVYEFSLPGGGFVSLEHLVEMLGIHDGTDTNVNESDAETADIETEKNAADSNVNSLITLENVTVSDAAKEFVANVADVTFSNPDLVDVSRVDQDMTVGQIKESRGLDVQYSDELTEEQINEINNSMVEAGDWVLISWLPFSTYETLTITMKDGMVYTIEVTDAQISTHVITADGKDFTITVTYGPEAEIPDNAKLEADEIVQGSDEYKDYLTKALDAMNSSDGNNTSAVDSSWARFFDIRIMAEGQKIEPAAPVTVTVSYEEALQIEEGDEVLAVHFGEQGIEVIEADTDQSNRKVVFRQDGFSVTGTVVTTPNSNWPQSVGEYVLFVQSGNKSYAIAHDGSLYEVAVSGNQLIFPDDPETLDINNYLWYYDVQPTWTGQQNRFLFYLDDAGTDHYIDPLNSSGISVNSRNLTRTYDGKIYNGNYYIGLQSSSIVGRSNQANGVPIRFANDFNISRHVTIHFVDRYGNDLTGISYTGPSDYPVIDNGDGTFTVPYRWDGMTGTLNLDTQFSKEGYTYASTHLSGTRQGTTLKHDGLTIDAALEERNNALYYRTDTIDNLQYGNLTERNLNDSLRIPNEAGTGVTDYLKGNINKDIYVILDPVPASIPGMHSSDLNAYDPEFNKTLEYNDDGTYTLALNVKGHGINTSADPKANVLFIVDTSSSMDKTEGTGTGYSRLHDTKPALKNIAKGLLSVNNLPGEDNDTVEVAMISFDGGVENELDWTTSRTDFDNAVDNRLDMHRGTDWEDALKRAYEIGLAKQAAEPDQQVFVVFFTDGEGSQYSNFHGQGSYNNGPGVYNYWYSYFLCRESAKDEARAIVNAGMQFYAIYAFNPDTGNYKGETGSDMLHNLVRYGYDTHNVTDNHFFARASSTSELEDALDAILQNIREFLGCSGIVMNDDITSLTSTGINLVGSAVGGFTYTRSGGRFGDGQTWTDAPLATHTDTEDGDVSSVKWNLGSTVLEDGVTYTVSFKVWPNQEAYDWLANLENGTKTWDDVVEAGLNAPDGENPQIVKNGDSYSLLTNKPSKNSDDEIINNVITYNRTHSEIIKSTAVPPGVVLGIPIEGTDADGNRTITTYTKENDIYIRTVVTEKITYFPNPDPMPLKKESMNVIKEWENSMNTSHPADDLKFRILVDGKYYQNDGTLVAGEEGLENATVLPVSAANNWLNSIKIAPGIVKYFDDDGNALDEALVLETGHKYTVEEFDLMEGGSAFLYYTSYEFHSQTMRPMIVDGTLKYLVLVDALNPAPQDAETCQIGNETYYVAGTGSGQGSLSGTNYRTPELDITKIIRNESGAPLTDAEMDAETFTYRVTLRIPDGTDPAGIVGYEYVPRTQSNAFTLFGYQIGETAFESDIERFAGKTFRSWNTLVYRDLVEWVNVGGRIMSVTDDDGNIIWKVPKDDEGYHNITYDMTLNRNEVIRFTNIPTGTKYSIQEIYANYYKADYAADSAGHAPITKVSNIDAEGYEISRVLTTNGTITQTAIANDTVSGTMDTPNVRYYNQFTNDLKLARAKITIVKTSQNGTTPLSGAVFNLYTKAGYEADPKEPLKTGLTSSDEAGSEGTIDLNKLKEGIYYLVETKAPDGYIPMTDPVVITVGHDTVTYRQEDSSLDDSGNGITGDFQLGYHLTVINNAGYELPSTGGSGTMIYRMIGLIMMCLATALLVRRRN